MAAATFTVEEDAGKAKYLRPTTTGYLPVQNQHPNAVGTMCIQVLLNGGTLSMTVNGRMRGSTIADADVDPLPYQKNGDATPDKAPTTAITAAGIYYIRADFLDVVLNITTLTGGPPFIYFLGGVG